MGWLKYDKAHMDRAAQLIGRPAPWPREPFTLGGRRSSDTFFRNWRVFVASAKTVFCGVAIKLFLGLCRIARKIWPNPRFRRLVIVTRDEDVREVLADNGTFIVPYTPEMIALAGGENSILGMDGSAHTEMGQLVASAMREIKTATGVSMDGLIEAQSAEVANALLDNSGGRIDVMTDLVTRTLTESACTYFGLKVNDPVEFARWTMAFSWLLFGDPQGNPAVRNEAMNAAPRLGLVIDQAIVAAKVAAEEAEKPQGFIRAMVDMQIAQQKKPAEIQISDASIRATVIGLIVALIPTNTLAAGNMLEELLRWRRRPQWREAIRLAKANDDQALKNLLLEAGRLKPALSPGLWRYVEQEGTIAAHAGWWRRRKVHPDDVVLAIVPSALRDRKCYPDNPHKFKADRPQYPDLMFGHGSHYCIGDRLAMIQITQIFKALLAREPELATRTRKAKSVGPFPVRLDMKFSPDRTQSTMIIITAPTARNYVTTYRSKKKKNEQPVTEPMAERLGWSYEDRKEEIEQAIAKLGNPAEGEIRASLERTGVVHFASISVVEANSEHSKPPILLIEINADGPRDDVLKAVADECFNWLMPIFSFVTDRVHYDRTLLFELLKLHARDLRCSPFDPVGLHFDGMRQFSVRNIERQAKLAAFAREKLDEHLKKALDGIGSASHALHQVREKIREDACYRRDLWQPSRNTLDIARWSEPRSFTGPFFSNVWKSRPVIVAIELFLVTWAILALALCHIFNVFREGVTGEGLPTESFAWTWTLLAAILGSLVATILLTLLILGIFALLLWKNERSDKSEDRQDDLERARDIARRENRFRQTQNHIIAVMPLKRGWFRRLTLAFTLWGIKQSLFWFRPGFVVKMGTIHYAKWFVIPGTDRFVFMANYDGSWESYLEDFITRAHEGQSAAWSNGVGFPMTRWLINYGAEDGDRFKRWVRNQQRPSLFWYCRFPRLSADQIRKNALIHDGLARATTSTESRAWLSTFGSEQRQEYEIEADEVQSLVFSGLPQSYFMTCVLLRVPTDPTLRAKWLRGLTGQPLSVDLNDNERWLEWDRDLQAQFMPRNLRVSFGDHNAPDGASILAFSATGLTKMGLPDEDKARGASSAKRKRPDNELSRSEDCSGIFSFPPVFRMGMANRKNILGDREASDPAEWLWSDSSVDNGAAPPVDAVLLIYGPPPKTDDEEKKMQAAQQMGFDQVRVDHRKAVGAQVAFLEHCGGSVVRRTETGPDEATWDEALNIRQMSGSRFSPIEKEHFGFRDGISQPAIRGTTKAIFRPAQRDIIAPGEFILGYRNNQDYFPPAFVVRTSDDLHNKLPTISANTPLRFPHFGRAATVSDDDRSAADSTDAMADYRDFGRNGTFLVLRDLEQDVEAFRDFINKQANEVNRGYKYLPNIIGREVDAQWVAAKMVGRWQNGAPLVGHPNRPPEKRKEPPENDFAYGTDDPRGLQCPLGAHIRRTNPRDSLQPGDPMEQAITNRHRLIRRGRTYVNGGDSESETGAKGMIFACICADLERQFEFVQQSWAASVCFHGLHQEPDPLIGGRNAKDVTTSQAVFSIPTAGGAVTLKNMKSYVNTRAGGYFFMPSRSALLYLSSLVGR